MVTSNTPTAASTGGRSTRNYSVSPTSLSGRRHLPVRAPDVRGDALLGDCRHGARPAVCVPGVHRLWQAAEKIMFSTTLESAPSTKTRIDRNFDRAMIRQLKSAIGHDMTVGGADLAGQAITAGLVGEVQLFLVPSSSEAASQPSPAVSAQNWNYWTHSGSQAALSTSRTASRQRDHLAGCCRPIAAPGSGTRPCGSPRRSPKSVSPETTPLDPRWPLIAADPCAPGHLESATFRDAVRVLVIPSCAPVSGRPLAQRSSPTTHPRDLRLCVWGPGLPG